MQEQPLSESDKTARNATVESLARSCGLEAEEVQALYESVLVEMKQKAVIMDFLPIFAAKKVREMLLQGRTATV